MRFNDYEIEDRNTDIIILNINNTHENRWYSYYIQLSYIINGI
jgi:hypothetical protein